jgi:hypothetical protein
MHVETARLVESPSQDPVRDEYHVAAGEAKKAGQGMTTPRCPHCCTGQGRWIEQPDLRHKIDYFIYVTCGYFWAAPMATPGRVGDLRSREA